MPKLNDAGKKLIHDFESLKLVAYMDPVGVPTIGWGHTKTVTAAHVKSGYSITPLQAEVLFDRDMVSVENDIRAIVKPAIFGRLGDNQYSALCSFVFNCGPRPTATLWKKINAGALDQVPQQLLRWSFARDRRTNQQVRLPGLLRRRRAEADLWNLDSKIVTAPHTWTATPPEITEGALPDPPMLRSRKFLASGIAAVAGSGAAITEVSAQVTPLTQNFPWAPVIVSVLAFAAALAGLAAMWVRYTEKKEAEGDA